MIENQARRRKIFYVPGMISLIFIPLLCFYHFYKVDAFKEEGCISFFYPTDSVSIKKFVSLERNYQDFTFNKSLDLETNNLNNLQRDLRQLNIENDTIKGVKIHLGSKMKYEVYIKILDILSIEIGVNN